MEVFIPIKVTLNANNIARPAKRTVSTDEGFVSRNAKGASVTACEVQSRCFDDSAQRPEYKPLSEYRVGQLAQGVLQAGTGLVRSTVGFVFSQVMNSHDIGAVAPGLKENLLVLAALYNEFQPTQAQGRCLYDEFLCNHKRFCIALTFQCDGNNDCHDLSDEGEGVCDQFRCEKLGREFLCEDNLYPRCIPLTDVCNNHTDCPDQSDESPELCSTITLASTTTPTMVPSSTEKAGPTAAYSEDAESSSCGWLAAPVIILRHYCL